MGSVARSVIDVRPRLRGVFHEWAFFAALAAGAMLSLIADGTLSGTLAKQVFEIMLETGEDANAIVEARGLKQTSDTGAIDAAEAAIATDHLQRIADACYFFSISSTNASMNTSTTAGCFPVIRLPSMTKSAVPSPS